MSPTIIAIENNPEEDGHTKKICCDFRKCLKRTIASVIIGFFIANFTVGLIESIGTFVVDFLVNHKEGSDGFTNFQKLNIPSLLIYEHQEWEQIMLEDPRKYDPSKEELDMIKFRLKIIHKCSRGEKLQELNDECFDRPLEYIERNYFCAIIEHPEKFEKAYNPLIKRWMGQALFYFCITPLVMFAFVWKSQTISLLVTYILLQIIPISLSISIIADLWSTHSFELCGLDFIYNEFKTRIFFTMMTGIRLICKILEILFTLWYIYTVHVEREQKDFGITSQGKSKVEPERKTLIFNNEILTPSRIRHLEEAEAARKEEKGKHFNISTMKKEKEEQEKEQRRLSKRQSMNLRQSLVLRSDAQLPADRVLVD